MVLAPTRKDLMSEARDAVLAHRFLHPGETTDVEVWRRVAGAWATDAAEEHAFFKMMDAGRAFPNTPAIANAGRELNMGSACFVLPIEDSMESIMETLKDAALVQKSGGGTGFDFSELRPAGALVKSTGRGAPGPASFLAMYSSAIAHITQAGMRPGANMCVIRADHPDVLKVLETKTTEGTITNFNISVAITDEFMAELRRGERHAQDVWEAITFGAWANGEPGVIFIDTVNRTSQHPEVIAATNPCGEVPLLPYEACVLGSVNLHAHVTQYRRRSQRPQPEIEWGLLEKTVRTLTTMLDNVIDLQTYPIPKIERTHKRYRKIGVGVMGFADALIELGVKYGSPGSVWYARSLMRFVQAVSYDQSKLLGTRKGFYPGHLEGMPPRRNLACQVIAPTGTISRLAECSFGIEPHFSREYDSHILGNVYHEEVALGGSEHFVASADVAPEAHVAIQAAFQEYTDQAVSKTVNLPEDASVRQISRLYEDAYDSGCKGVTVLRAQSRADVVIDPSCPSGVCEV